MRKVCQEILGRCLYLVMVAMAIFGVNIGGGLVCAGLMTGAYQIVFAGAVLEVISIAFAIWCEMFTAAPWRDMISAKRLRREPIRG